MTFEVSSDGFGTPPQEATGAFDPDKTLEIQIPDSILDRVFPEYRLAQGRLRSGVARNDLLIDESLADDAFMGELTPVERIAEAVDLMKYREACSKTLEMPRL